MNTNPTEFRCHGFQKSCVRALGKSSLSIGRVKVFLALECFMQPGLSLLPCVKYLYIVNEAPAEEHQGSINMVY